MKDAIYPGRVWTDTKRVRIEAHGGSVYYDQGKYWWIGEDKSHTTKKGRIWTWGVHAYSSENLIDWADEGFLVPAEPDDRKSLFHPYRRLDRPHLLKNHKTGKYVLWLKYCDKSHYTVLTADELLGPYTVVEAFLQPYGHKAGDFDLALDDTDGSAYLYFEADHDSVLVCRLNDTYTNTVGESRVIYSGIKPPLAREGVTHFIHDGRHYLLTSGMTGYIPNPSEVAVSDDWMGPFRVLGDPHVNDESSASFNSQISCVFQIHGSEQLIACADRWVPDYVMTKERYDIMLRAIAAHSDRSIKVSLRDKIALVTSPMMGSADTSKANYVWLPISWNEQMPQIAWHDRWMPEEL